MNKIEYSVQKSHNGIEEIFIPKENGVPFEPKSGGRYARWMVSYRTLDGAKKFLVKQGANSAEITVCQPVP